MQSGEINKSTNAIATALPMLTAMQMAFHKTLKVTTNQPTWWWVKLGFAVAAGSILAFTGDILLLQHALIAATTGATLLSTSGVVTAGAAYATTRWIKQLQEEYINILRIWAVSLGVCMEQVRNH